MIYAFFIMGACIGFIIGFGWHINQHHKDVTQLWSHIEILQADNRALTESLCRTQGKPYITSMTHATVPSEGWFDGAPRVKGGGN